MALTNHVLNRAPFSLGNGTAPNLFTYTRNNLFRGLRSAVAR